MRVQPRRAVVLLFLSLLPTLAAAGAQVPELNWEERSDWVNVKTAVSPGAVGDGKADDTAAIQAALDKLADGVTIYFPPGTYRITKTLINPPTRAPGASLIGHGRSTILAWDGEQGGRMFWTNQGMLYTRFVGLTWDGRGKAAVGFDHASQKVFETEMRHQHECYRDFTEAGIRIGVSKVRVATAETLYDNCLFERCGHGVSLHAFNVLDHTFDGCEFRECGVGVFGDKGTNFYVRNSHFEQSKEADLVCKGEQGSSVRRCTSSGSKTFLKYASSVGPMVVQDCRVDGWTDAQAVMLDGAPVLMFDCEFTNPPAGGAEKIAAVRTGRAGQRLVVSNTYLRGAGAQFKLADGGEIIDLPMYNVSGITHDPKRSFLRDAVGIPTKVFDAKRDFGAKGDGQADDTAAVVKAVAAAREYGKGAIAYFPRGKYAVSETIKLTGGDYFVGGSGFRSAIVWKGPSGGTTVEVVDPQNLTIENLVVGHHDSGKSEAGIDVLQRGSTTGKPTFVRYDRVWAWGMYQKKPTERGIHLVGLKERDRIHFKEVNGNLHLTDAAAGTVFAGTSYEGTLLVEGKSTERGGFIGGGVRLATVTDPGIWIKDNQSVVWSDFYSESTNQVVRLEGDAKLPAGRVTLAGAKFETLKKEFTGFRADNYRGDVCFGPYQFYVGNPQHRFTQTGDAPFSLTILCGLFYNSRPEASLAPGAKFGLVGVEHVALDNANDKVNAVAGGVTDTQPDKEARGSVLRALEDLRRLGTVEAEMNRVE